MGRVFTFVIVMTAMALLFEFLGFGFFGPTLMAKLGITESTVDTGYDLKSTTFYLAVAAILATAAGGIAVSFFTRTASENYVILPFIAASMILFIDVVAGILQQAGSYEPWISAILMVIFLPLSIGYIVTMVEFFRGNV